MVARVGTTFAEQIFINGQLSRFAGKLRTFSTESKPPIPSASCAIKSATECANCGRQLPIVQSTIGEMLTASAQLFAAGTFVSGGFFLAADQIFNRR
jgi:hypothetical protein